jgi:hypothetical protein
MPMPDIRIATSASNPPRSGARAVAPNIATTCCRPRATVCGQGSRSSGAIAPSVLSVQRASQGEDVSLPSAVPATSTPVL